MQPPVASTSSLEDAYESEALSMSERGLMGWAAGEAWRRGFLLGLVLGGGQILGLWWLVTLLLH